jgi:hypothetical protein
MAQGTLEVLLVGAKGLENTDYLSTHASALPPPSIVEISATLLWSHRS